MAKSKKNIHGLTRYIPSDIARKIRKDSGYGCVICGDLFTDYEHIEPEFHNAREHNPDKMTLLCGSHHDDVTHHRISKKAIWKAKENPKNKPGGILSRTMYHQKSKPEIKLGSIKIAPFEVVISIHDKPLVWFENSEDIDEPIQLCAILNYGDRNNNIFICRNVFKCSVSNYDVITKSANVTIYKGRQKMLSLKFEGDKDVEIEFIKINYKKSQVSIDKKLELSLSYDGMEQFTMRNSNINDVGKGLNISPLPVDRYDGIGTKNLISTIVECGIFGEGIVSFNGDIVGWLVDGLILDKNYAYKAISDVFLSSEKRAYTLSGEFFGYIKNSTFNNKKTTYICFPNDEYESGEPILIKKSDRASIILKTTYEFDVGHRVFPWEDCYR